jgi:hypothetical protein
MRHVHRVRPPSSQLSRRATAVAIALCMTTLLASSAEAQLQVQEGHIGRLRRLPICTFSPTEDSFAQFFEAPNPWDFRWACYATPAQDRQECVWSGNRPADAEYQIWPKYPHNVLPREMVWPSGTAVYGLYAYTCTRNPSNPNHDQVRSASIEALTRNADGDMLVAHLSGGFVEHIRPAYVEASISLARDGRWENDASWDDDLELAIQVLRDQGWQDVVTSTPVKTDATQRTYRVQGDVPQLHDVRLEVRYHEYPDSYQSVYNVTDSSIFVETCVPDAGNPGECLSCGVGGAGAARGLAPVGLALLLLGLRARRRPSRGRDPSRRLRRHGAG